MSARWTRSGGGMVVVIMVVVMMVVMNMLYYYTQSFNIPNKGGERLIDRWSEVRKLFCYPAILYEQIFYSLK